jgi:hypothetical protein
MQAMRTISIFGIGCSLILSVLTMEPAVRADVSPGDVIDKTNWQKAEGLLPEPVLNWIKKGDFVINIGELNYSEKEYFEFSVKESLTANMGLYEVNEKDIIIDAKTGKTPTFISGLPFPEVDPEDPKAGQKFLYNKHYTQFNTGNQDVSFQALWVGQGGFEREIGAGWISAPMDGYPKARSIPNPDGIQRYTLISVDRPYDIAGLNLLLWRYKDERQDLNLSYIPAIRRVRRMSPANRSDAFVGSDFCIDDPNGYDGKVCVFEWKVVRKQEALIPYKSKDPERLMQTKRGAWQTTPDVTPSVYGFQTEGWQGAPWAPVNLFWVKKTVYVIEASSKDRYYNYGKQEMWYDPDVRFPKYKIIYDRAGDYWKTMMIGFSAYGSADGKMKFMLVDIQDIVDDRSHHASLCENASKRNLWKLFTEVEMDDFTLSGFQKYCK